MLPASRMRLMLEQLYTARQIERESACKALIRLCKESECSRKYGILKESNMCLPHRYKLVEVAQ